MTEQERLEKLQQQIDLERSETARTLARPDLSHSSRNELEAELHEERWKDLYTLVPAAIDTYEEIMHDENATHRDRKAVADSVLDRVGLVKKPETEEADERISAQTLMVAISGIANVFGAASELKNVTETKKNSLPGDFIADE